MNWSQEGTICPGCGGAGRHSPRYPAALCEKCVETLRCAGRPVELSNETILGTGVRIENSDGRLPDNASLFAHGLECRAREAHSGGIVVQPAEAWGIPGKTTALPERFRIPSV